MVFNQNYRLRDPLRVPLVYVYSDKSYLLRFSIMSDIDLLIDWVHPDRDFNVTGRF